jgi:hypothetical protein
MTHTRHTRSRSSDRSLRRRSPLRQAQGIACSPRPVQPTGTHPHPARSIHRGSCQGRLEEEEETEWTALYGLHDTTPNARAAGALLAPAAAHRSPVRHAANPRADEPDAVVPHAGAVAAPGGKPPGATHKGSDHRLLLWRPNLSRRRAAGSAALRESGGDSRGSYLYATIQCQREAILQ